MAVDEKYPQWMRIRTNDTLSPQGRHILGSGTTAEWASYGRWCFLRQELMSMPNAAIGVSTPRDLRGLAARLGLGPKKLREWLALLAECGAIDPEAYGHGVVTVAECVNQQASYLSAVERARVNGRQHKARE